jgi:hypothetical protein
MAWPIFSSSTPGRAATALDVVIVQTMAGVDVQADGRTVFNGATDARQFGFSRLALGIGETAGVDFHHGGAGGLGGVKLTRLRIDEQGHSDAGVCQAGAGIRDFGLLPGDIQSAFGGQFLTPLRHQADILRLDLKGDADHLLGDGHFQIHARLQEGPEGEDIGILNVAPIFAQVQGDQVGAGRLGEQSSLQWTGKARAARLAQRGDVVDVDAEFDHFSDE